MSEVDLLKTQIALYKEFEEKLISNVHWALGVISTLVVLLIGYGWYSNYRIYERDKENLASTMQNALEKRIVEAERSFSALYEERIKEMSALHEGSANDIRLSMKTMIEGPIRDLKREFLGAVSSLRQDLSSVQFDMLIGEADRWCNEKVYSNAIRAAANVINLSMTMDHPFYLGHGLDKMHRCLALLVEAEQYDLLDSDDISNYSAIIEKLPPKYAIPGSAIREQLALARSRAKRLG